MSGRQQLFSCDVQRIPGAAGSLHTAIFLLLFSFNEDHRSSVSISCTRVSAGQKVRVYRSNSKVHASAVEPFIAMECNMRVVRAIYTVSTLNSSNSQLTSSK